MSVLLAFVLSLFLNGGASAAPVPEKYVLTVEALRLDGSLDRKAVFNCLRAEPCWNSMEMTVDGKLVKDVLVVGRVRGHEFIEVDVGVPHSQVFQSSLTSKLFTPGVQWEVELRQLHFKKLPPKPGQRFQDTEEVWEPKARLRYTVTPG